eukprot:1927158-Amphidinium_carterae.1
MPRRLDDVRSSIPSMVVSRWDIGPDTVPPWNQQSYSKSLPRSLQLTVPNILLNTMHERCRATTKPDKFLKAA